ncbi:MAG: hypothetical protein KF832_01900 [Caldilineaceae bacterium]|nr:hypothetical protein [Caldilineaceae bacterium]
MLVSLWLLTGCNQSPSVTDESVHSMDQPTLPQRQLPQHTGSAPTVNNVTATPLSPLVATAFQRPTLAVSATIPISIPWNVALDSQFVYWVDEADPNAIKAIRLRGPSQIEKVVEGSISGGVVSNMTISRNDRWLVYWNSKTRYLDGMWKLQALDRQTGQQKVILENSGAPYETRPIPAVAFVWTSLGDDQIALSYALEPETNGCQQIILRVVDLANGDNRLIKKVDCGKDDTIWVWPQLYGESLVFDQDRNVAAGGGIDVALYNLNNGQWQTLSDDHLSTQPRISRDYIIWKRAWRSDYGKSIGVYERRNGGTRVVDFPTQFPQAHLSDQWVYWIPDGPESLYIYDLRQDAFVLIFPSHCTQYFNMIAMRGSIIAWERSAGGINDSVLEWKDVTNLPAGEFVACR